MNSNLLYLQGGGPTGVINRTALGVYSEAWGKFGKILAARHGLEGLVYEVIHDFNEEDVEGIGNTPSAGFGTTRFELFKQTDETKARVIEVLCKRGITHVITNGGGDTSETALTLFTEARKRGYPLIVVHTPKTIDNDLPEIDHCPGFGTAATYVANMFVGKYLDSKACKHIRVDIAMGRVAGWLAAATLLSKDSGIEGPHAIYVPEHNATLDMMLEKIGETYRQNGFCHIVVSEGYGETLLKLDKTKLSGSSLQVFLEQKIKDAIGKDGKVEPYGYPQRSTIIPGSESDSREAYEVGLKAVQFALKTDRPVMVSMNRVSNDPYIVEYVPVDLARVATPGTKIERKMPAEYLGPPGVVKDSYLEYVRPLAGQIIGVVELRSKPLSKLLPPYDGKLIA